MSKIYLPLVQLCLIVLLFTQCQTESNKTAFTLSNNSEFNLTDKAISFQKSDVGDLPEGKLFPLIQTAAGDTIPAQLNDLDGDKNWDELFFVVNLPANSKANYTLEWIDSELKFPVRTSARFGKRMAADEHVKPALSEVLKAPDLPKSLGFQRYQTDGPSWENDKVGFRHYLDGRNAKDLFGKKTTKMSPENVGINADGAVEDNYHVMEDWGRDVLAVGNSVGIGGYALKVGDDLLRLGVTVDDSVNNVEETTFRILAEGPVKSMLNYRYKNWNTNDRTYAVNEITSIWPGMYGYQNSVKFSGLKGDEELAVGLVNINTENALMEIKDNEKFVVLYTHDKQTYDKIWWLGLAIIVPRDLYLGYVEAPKTGQLSNSFMARLKVENEVPVNYYAVACWELSDEQFINEEYFKDYITDLTNQLAVDVEVSFK